MANLRIDGAVASDLSSAIKPFAVAPIATDGITDQKETKWTNERFEEYFGYYKTIPELRAVIDAKATWTGGKGFEADEETTILLDSIRGWGKDTFNTNLENGARTKEIGGDFFAEVIRDEDEILINLKPLDPSVIDIIVDDKGMVLRYEQNAKIKGSAVKKFKPEEIFHLPRNRVADEIHGVSMIEALVNIVLMKNEAMTDNQRLLHRNIDPLWIFHLDTDDTSEIASFKAKNDKARARGENMYIPKDVVVPELVSVAGNATMNPLAWITYLDNAFYEAAGVPKIILGGSGEFTEASAKIAYLAFQQNIEEEQLFIEEAILNQLNLVVKLSFPASLENELLSDEKKDGDQSINPSETTAGQGQ